MARALENPDAKPSYLDYFGMTQPPFSQLSAPSQLFHSDQYSLLADHLTSATEQPDFLLVICGAEGSGKTTLLNRHILSLDEDVSYATFDETSADGTQFYCGLLRQLGFHDISGKLNELRNIAREFLIHRGMAGDPVLIIIDNAHLVCASVLEQLRWIAETKVDHRRVLSIVLAGNSDLPRIMGSPAMKRLKFQHHVDFNIRAYTEQETEDYVRHRLRLSGGADAAKISDEAHPVIYRFSGGNPNAINALYNTVLTEACALDTRVISGDLIRSVAETHEILPHVVPLQGMGRRKSDSSVSLVMPVQRPEERIIARDPPPGSAFEGPVAGSAVADVNIKDLLNQVSQLSGQLAVQTQKTETLSDSVLDDADEIERLNKALSDTEKALRESESAANELTAKADAEIEALERKTSELQVSAKQLTADLKLTNKRAAKTDVLEKSLKQSRDECETLRSSAAESKREIRAAKKAMTAAGKAEAKIEKLEREKSEMQVSVKDLNADLKIAKKQATRIDALEKSLKESQDDCESLRSSAADSKNKMRAAKKTTTAAAKVEAKIEELEHQNSEMRASVKGLTTELELASQRASETDALEKSLKKSEDECESLRVEAANSRNEIRAAKRSKTAADKAKTKTKTKIEKLEREKLELQDQFDSLHAGAEALKTLEESASRKDARIAELEAELDTYSKADMSNQPELPGAQAESPSTRSKPDNSVEQTVDAIAIIEVIREGEIDQVMNLADVPSRIMLGRGDDCELRLDSKFVSRHHALIFCTDKGVCIEDLNSFNGTVVNSRKVSRCDLYPDDKVTIGDFQLRPRPAVKSDPV